MLSLIKRRVPGFICAAFLALACGPAQAASLKNSEFMEFSEGQRHWWQLGVFAALGHVVLLEDKEKGKCVLNWMYEKDKDRKALLVKSFKQYPDHTPTSIVIALLRRDCGVFLEEDKTTSMPK